MLQTLRKSRQDSGFTIVELLIVIVVIAILATFAIMSYAGIQKRALETGLRSDLQTAAKKLETYKIQNGTYPASDVGDAGVKNSSNVSFLYTYNPGEGSYCLAGTSGGTTYNITATDTQPGNYTCITILAGARDESSGYVNGVGTNARFRSPGYITLAPDGMIYVSDGVGSGTNYIRKINPATAEVSTVIDLGATTPQSLAVAANGTIYFTSLNATPYCVKKVVSGVVSNVTCSYSLDYPMGLVLGTDNNLYLVDSTNHTIKRINPSTGATTIVAGASGVSGSTDSATGTSARFFEPQMIAVGPDGNFYITDSMNSKIRRMTLAGAVSTIAGTGGDGYVDGPALQAQIAYPFSIAVDSAGTVYFTDYAEGYVRALKNGVVSTLVGGTKYPSITSGLAVSPTQQGVIYMGLYARNQIIKLQ